MQRRLPVLPSRLPNLATVLAAGGYHVVLKGKLHPASEVERARLHRRLVDVMRTNGTMPDEIRWPEVDEYQPSPTLSLGTEDEELLSQDV